MSHRAERVRDLLIEVGSEILRRVKDPALGQDLISITDVKVAADLGTARFYISVLADPLRQQEVLKALERAAGFFRHELRHEVRLKRIPEVRFELDHTLEHAAHMMKVLQSARVQTEPVPPPEPPPE
jgi:ribosome-binding factor A